MEKSKFQRQRDSREAADYENYGEKCALKWLKENHYATYAEIDAHMDTLLDSSQDHRDAAARRGQLKVLRAKLEEMEDQAIRDLAREKLTAKAPEEAAAPEDNGKIVRCSLCIPEWIFKRFKMKVAAQGENLDDQAVLHRHIVLLLARAGD